VAGLGWFLAQKQDQSSSVRILALVARRTGEGVKRGKQGLGGRGGSEIQPNLLWTQYFFPIAGA
jgi:hypothetical protein